MELVLLIVVIFWILHGFYRDFVARSKQTPIVPSHEDRIEQIYPSKKEPTRPKRTDPTTFDLPDIKSTPNLMYISREAKLAYMKTQAWQNLKLSRLRIAQHKCEHCGSINSLQLHHITYIRLTKELIEDVIVLCSVCHQQVHDILGYDRQTQYPISILKDRT